VLAIIYDFKTIGGALRKQRIDDWWQPARPKSEPEAAESIASEDWFDPLADLIGKGGRHERTARRCRTVGRRRGGLRPPIGND
jgi:hypothetical protein